MHTYIFVIRAASVWKKIVLVMFWDMVKLTCRWSQAQLLPGQASKQRETQHNGLLQSFRVIISPQIDACWKTTPTAILISAYQGSGSRYFTESRIALGIQGVRSIWTFVGVIPFSKVNFSEPLPLSLDCSAIRVSCCQNIGTVSQIISKQILCWYADTHSPDWAITIHYQLCKTPLKV